MGPPKYRCLYRIYGKLRLRMFSKWYKMWSSKELRAGVPGRGAEDGWLTIAALSESVKRASSPSICAALDISKCFDQANRPVLYGVMLRSGFPRR
eukprot:14612406-Alexandrium_andersonii.AAC.1